MSVLGQVKLPKQASKNVEEGKLLYKLEMASWDGTDLFLEEYSNIDNIGGYFSYYKDNNTKCVFFSSLDIPKVIGTVSFDDSSNIETADIDLLERDFTEYEYDLYTLRKIAFEEIYSDDLFEMYENTSLNLIPLITSKEKKVFVLTGPQQSGVVIFGNDYLLTFSKKNKLKSKKRLHNNIIAIYYGTSEENEEISMHSHLPETGNFITATDICTLMLYSKFANWKTHNVVSKKYLNIWNCETNELILIPMKTVTKIAESESIKDK